MDINEILKTTPASKYEACEQAEIIRKTWQEAKEELKRKEALHALTCKAQNLKLTIADLKYLIDKDDELYKLRLDIIVKESNYRKKETEINKYDDAFTGAKMLAKLKIAEMRNLGDTVSKKGEWYE